MPGWVPGNPNYNIVAMLYADYKTEVFRCYELKKAQKLISSRLAHPTTANLRDECMAACAERFSIRDQGILKTFFGQIGDDVNSCVKVIKQCDPDRFRPLVNFLKRQTTETNVRNVDLLAWLIDYKDRPYAVGAIASNGGVESENYLTINDENGVVDPLSLSGGKTVIDPRKNTPKKTDKQLSKRKSNSAISAILIVVALGIATIWMLSNNKVPDPKTSSQMCMYWVGDHYEPVDCNQKVNNALVIALDSHRLKHFRKITDIKTISQNSIGKVWYIKLNNNIEFYTSSGYHPVEVRRTLRPVSRYIFHKYVLQNP